MEKKWVLVFEQFKLLDLHLGFCHLQTLATLDPPPPLPTSKTMNSLRLPPHRNHLLLTGARVHFRPPEDAIEVSVDGFPIKIPKGFTVLQACEVTGVDIPHFYYHSRLSIIGNYRMLLIKVEKSPKPVASCPMPALPAAQVLACKNVFSGSFQKVPRSPTPCSGKTSKSDSETKRKSRDEGELPIRLLADIDSLFIACQGLTLHYKISFHESALSRSLTSTTFLESSPSGNPRSTPARLKLDRQPLTVPSKAYNLHRSISNHFQSNPLYASLLVGQGASFFSDEVPALNLDDCNGEVGLSNSVALEEGAEGVEKFGIVIVHRFGGGVFLWRHVMGILAR